MEELKRKYLEAHLEYLNAMKEEYINDFSNKLRELGKTHPKYTLSCSDSNPIPDSNLKQLYHECMLKYHPDKNQEDTTSITQKINELYRNNDRAGLERILNGKGYSLSDLEREVKKITGTYYWMWGEGDSSTKEYIQDMFTSEEEAKNKVNLIRQDRITFLKYFDHVTNFDEKTDEEIYEIYNNILNKTN